VNDVFDARVAPRVSYLYRFIYVYTYIHRRARARARAQLARSQLQKKGDRTVPNTVRACTIVYEYIRGTAAKYCARIDLASFLVSFSHANLFSRCLSLIYPLLIVFGTTQPPTIPPTPRSIRAVGRLTRQRQRVPRHLPIIDFVRSTLVAFRS